MIVCTNSPTSVPPAGHYSHTCTAGGFVFVSGILPVTADGKPLVDASFEAQALQVFANLDGYLAGCGIARDRLVQVRVYVTEMASWPEFNRLYAAWIGDHRPARAVAGVAELHHGLALEIEAVALA